MQKLLQRALDGCAEPEANAAASAVFRELRSRGVLWADAWKYFHPPACLLTVMPWGKYKGRTVAWIAEHDPDYCSGFLATDAKSKWIRKCASEALSAVHSKT